MTNLDKSELMEAARILARAMDRLGNADAATPMGGLEGLGEVVGRKLGEVADSITGVSAAAADIEIVVTIIGWGEALEKADSFIEAMDNIADSLRVIADAVAKGKK